MKIVFISCPDINEAEKQCRAALKKGLVPVAPHMYFPRFMGGYIPGELEATLRINKIVLRLCDELWVFGPRLTDSMVSEIRYAKRLGIPVQYFQRD